MLFRSVGISRQGPSVNPLANAFNCRIRPIDLLEQPIQSNYWFAALHGAFSVIMAMLRL